MRLALPATLALLLGLGCAKQTGARPDAAEPAPAWASREGREKARLELAVAMIAAGTPESALKLVGQMRAEGQSGVDVDVVQARALREVGLLDDAASLLEETVKRHPRDVAARKELGILRVDQQKLPEAVQLFQSAVKLDDTDAELWNNLGFTLMAAGRLDEATEALRQSLKLDSSRDQTRNNLGFALVASGRLDEAWRVFRAAQGPAAAHYNVGVGLELRGDDAAARARYQKALDEAPSYVLAREALSRLSPPAPPPPLPAPEVESP